MAEQNIRLTGNQLAQLANQERQKLAQINNRIGSIQGLRSEMQAAKDALEEIAKSSKGDEMLVNLGAGVYLKAIVSENSKAIAPVAGNAFAEKNTEELAKQMEKKLENLDMSMENIAVEQEKIMVRINQLEQIMEAGMRAIRGGAGK